jgi:hypothetical protein
MTWHDRVDNIWWWWPVVDAILFDLTERGGEEGRVVRMVEGRFEEG